MVSINAAAGTMNLPVQSSVVSEDLTILVQELRELGFDAIRFASYRTAAKLRFIQKKSKVYLLDIWNVIEAVRDNGLNGIEPYSIITVPKVESILMSLYINLNKRLPLEEQVDPVSCSRYLLSWFLIGYDNEGSGRIRVFSVKVGLVTLCSGKLIDKLRYIFSQISDSNGCLVFQRFAEYLQEVLTIPAMVLESPTFGYTDGLALTIFDGTSKVSVNGFLDAILGEPGPPCIMWMPLLHTLAAVEDVKHAVPCSVCKSETIQGFRYKCQKCSNYNMCQSCFWQGKTSECHKTEHEVKEYSSNKSLGGSLRNSFRKSFRCVPEKPKKMPRFPDQPEKTLNLSHIVPPSPLPVHNGFNSTPYEVLEAYSDRRMFADLGYGPSPPMPHSSCSESLSESDEEHRLIARYTARLASENKYPPAPYYTNTKPAQRPRTVSQTSGSLFGTTQNQRDLIAQLEAKNREIMQEISMLRAQEELTYMNGDPYQQPMLLEELHALRNHKSDLEEKLAGLQDSRIHLMEQMEGLMRLLKTQQHNQTYTTLPHPRRPKTNYCSNGGYSTLNSSASHKNRSAPVTPQHQHHPSEYSSITGELRSAYSTGEDDLNLLSGSTSTSTGSSTRYVRNNDLLVAADSVTHAMSSLVKELNSGSDEEDETGMKPLVMEYSRLPEHGHDDDYWDPELEKKRLEEEEKYLEELRNMRLSNGNVNELLDVDVTPSSEMSFLTSSNNKDDKDQGHGGRDRDLRNYHHRQELGL